MIEEIRLRDLGVIADATLPLGAGFTAITGETGAGKTMVVSALALLLGARSDSSVVRAGADKAVVEGIWRLPAAHSSVARVEDAGGEPEPVGEDQVELYLGRTVSREGRSRATAGGRTVPAGVLSDIADELVVVHGQSDQLRLRSAAAQRDALDRFGAAPIATAAHAYRTLFDRRRSLQSEWEELTTRADERRREAERLRAEVEEISALDPQPGEDEELTRRAERLGNVEELRTAATEAHEALSTDSEQPDVTLLLASARRALERVDGSDPALAEVTAGLVDIGYRVSDLAASLSDYALALSEAGPQELADVEDRRAALTPLVRRHGSLQEALDFGAAGALRLAELDDDPERIEQLAAELETVDAELDSAAAALTAARRAAAESLGEAVTTELRALALPDAQVEVDVTETTPSASGRDDVTFLLASHPGATPRPVARSASGGELSRVMLAIEVVIAGTEGTRTFVFDEIDAGIGGAAAIEIGRRLATLAETSQVIAVTHLAQVAAFAGNHLSVVKSHDGSVTASDVRALDGADREAEMARLLSGLSDSGSAIEHARELLGLRTATRRAER